MYMYTLTCKHI